MTTPRATGGPHRSGRGRAAVAASVLAPLAVATVLLPFRDDLANTSVALVLVLVIVGVAATGHRVAGLLAALSAAVWFNFFWTVPYQTLVILSRADVETAVLLLLVGLAVTEVAVWGHRQQAAASREAGFRDGLLWQPRRRWRPETPPARSSTASRHNWCRSWVSSAVGSTTAPGWTIRGWSTTAP